MKKAMRIMGIDPGLRHMGWGVIETIGNRLSFIACGRISSDAQEEMACRLRFLYDGLIKVLEEYSPDEVSIEQVFVNKNAASSLKLGQARGVALLSAALKDIPIFEYAPNCIKKAIVGVGHSEKMQIHTMVKVLLPKAELKTNDAADALATAICHAHYR